MRREQKLYTFVQRNDLEGLKQTLSQIEAIPEAEVSLAFGYACNHNRAEIIACMLDMAQHKLSSEDLESGLSNALTAPYSDYAKILVEKGFHKIQQQAYGGILEKASKQGKFFIVHTVLKHASAPIPAETGRIALYHAIAANSLVMVDTLLDYFKISLGHGNLAELTLRAKEARNPQIRETFVKGTLRERIREEISKKRSFFETAKLPSGHQEEANKTLDNLDAFSWGSDYNEKKLILDALTFSKTASVQLERNLELGTPLIQHPLQKKMEERAGVQKLLENLPGLKGHHVPEIRTKIFKLSDTDKGNTILGVPTQLALELHRLKLMERSICNGTLQRAEPRFSQKKAMSKVQRWFER